MSGPIIRTGSTPEFAQGWERIFGTRAASSGKKSSTGKKSTAKSVAKQASPKKAAKKKAAKKGK